MADRPGSYKNGPRVSHRTMIMRKAKDADAERLAKQDEAVSDADGKTRVLQTDRPSSRAPEHSGESKISRRDRTVSGRTVVIRRDGVAKDGRLTVSTKLSGQQAVSVRVTGGDTIIRYQSGDMVIKRGARRAQLRRQLIWSYALGYLLLFSVYTWFLFTGTYTMTAEEYISRAFARRHSSDIIDLERAALEAMRGNRTPAEIRPADNLSFHDENHDMIRIAAGDRLTLVTAAKLGKAILDDQKREPGKREFSKPFRFYKETYLANIHWPYWLTFYNALGFFLLLILFLWRPLMNFLGTQGKKTAVALRNARQAQQEAEEYRNRYRNLSSELAERENTLRSETESRAEADREQALEQARALALEMEGAIDSALAAEARTVNARLGVRTAVQACDEARKILEQRLGQREHDAAIDELIADIAGMRLAGTAEDA